MTKNVRIQETQSNPSLDVSGKMKGSRESILPQEVDSNLHQNGIDGEYPAHHDMIRMIQLQTLYQV
jgi:hypothetical protein